MKKKVRNQATFPEAWIDTYEDVIPAMTNHAKDRRVRAAAVRAGARIIVTYNIGTSRTSLTPLWLGRGL